MKGVQYVLSSGIALNGDTCHTLPQSLFMPQLIEFSQLPYVVRIIFLYFVYEETEILKG
jgi:hypothetical protein